MNVVNMWIAIPEDDHNELNNRRGTINNVGPAKAFVDGQIDPAVVQNMYATHQQGQTVRHLWSVLLDASTSPHSVNEFRQEFPGAQVLGCWNFDGSQLRDENGNIRYEISDQLANYMPDDAEMDPVTGDVTYTPNPTVRDIHLVAGWGERDFS